MGALRDLARSGAPGCAVRASRYARGTPMTSEIATAISEHSIESRSDVSTSVDTSCDGSVTPVDVREQSDQWERDEENGDRRRDDEADQRASADAPGHDAGGGRNPAESNSSWMAPGNSRSHERLRGRQVGARLDRRDLIGTDLVLRVRDRNAGHLAGGAGDVGDEHERGVRVAGFKLLEHSGIAELQRHRREMDRVRRLDVGHVLADRDARDRRSPASRLDC